MKTSLGWIVSGSTVTNIRYQHTIFINHANVDIDLNKSLRGFWEVEELPRKRYLTVDEQACEEFYNGTVTRTETGNYEVSLPKKPDTPDNWGNSYSIAVNTLLGTERRFSHNAKLKKSYVDCMHDYIVKGHMRLISDQTIDLDRCYFSPHHGVIKESSTTTQFRLVWNASRKSNIGLSANDCLYTGPNLLPEIIVILTRWRMYLVAFVADIEKMFRQIWVKEEDQHLQAFVWRDEADQEIQTYFLTTVTFGFAPSPYLANRTIKLLSQDEEVNYPLAAEVLRNEIYMDDVLSGGQDRKEAKKKQHQVIKMMASGGFNLRKWMSNDKSLIESLPQELRATAASLKIGSGFSVLGMAWDPDRDWFYFNIALEVLVDPETKMSVLAKVAKLYDPLGWIAPVIIVLKIFMQSLWLLTREWDSPLPDEYVSQWTELYTSLQPIADIRIKRWIGVDSLNQRYEFHGFADASKLAYAAVVYLRVLGENTQVFLLGAKTKVTPTKTLSIPRLELCAAQLATKLTKHFVDTLQLSGSVHLWSDSRDVLYWLRDIPSKWPTFIANRCSDITITMPDAYWHHINSSDNPADVASRGSSAYDLISNSLWWNGPKWLSESRLDWSQAHDIEPRKDKRHKSMRSEQKPVSILLVSPKSRENWELLDKFSSLHKLLRVTSYLLRFVSRTVKNASFKNKVSPLLQKSFAPSSTHLTSVELRNAELVWCTLTQSVCYASQVGILQRGEELRAEERTTQRR